MEVCNKTGKWCQYCENQKCKYPNYLPGECNWEDKDGGSKKI